MAFTLAGDGVERAAAVSEAPVGWEAGDGRADAATVVKGCAASISASNSAAGIPCGGITQALTRCTRCTLCTGCTLPVHRLHPPGGSP